MTMQNSPHPDDERLAAYASGDSDALADSSLASHLTACDRCRPLVDELSLLHAALAELPDLAPSRPLRLIPPVPSAAVPAAGPGSWLRRLTAPAMAAGVGLFLVGAIGIGASGAVSFLGGAASGPALQEADASDREFGQIPGAGAPSRAPDDTRGSAGSESSVEPATMGSSQPASATPSADAAEPKDQLTDNPSPEQPWLTLLIAGVGVFGISTALRFSLSPRAG